MSPPDTNLRKQKRLHRGPLIWMALAVVIAIAVAVVIMLSSPSGEEDPNAQISEEGSVESSIREGDIDLSDDAPTETVEPADPDVEVVE